MRGKAPFQISEDDFGQYQHEFRVWLLDRHDVSLERLDERKARKHFRKFVDKWNGDRVEESIYKLAHERRKRADSNGSGPASSVDEKRKKQGQLRNEITEVVQAESSRPERWEIKKWRKREKDVLDELVPKPDPGSQAARMDKKRRKRGGGGDSPPEVTDSTLYGTNHSDLKEVIAKRKASRDRKNKARKAAADERIEALEEKERQRMQAFKDRLGLGDRFQTGDSKPP
ncbi:hypothetical protein NDN08_001642 [Rhodosorus marinus]|uniref:Uncharacterized protein n=1 Tax=Rhodosorus marinus TaxID=101924 RepID=A0AAV8UV53_9RHOD|nr:hypothetical protein NDN08_001642 [Rhodosorus marinus]